VWENLRYLPQIASCKHFEGRKKNKYREIYHGSKVTEIHLLLAWTGIMVKAVRRVKHVISSCLVTSLYVAHSTVAINLELNYSRHFGNAVSKSFSTTMLIKEVTYSYYSEKSISHQFLL